MDHGHVNGQEKLRHSDSCVGPMLRPEEITDSDEIIIGTPEGDNMSVPI